MKATIVKEPDPKPVTIQITATPLQLAVLGEILFMCANWDKLPGGSEVWEALYTDLAEAGRVFTRDAYRIVDAAGAQYFNTEVQ